MSADVSADRQRRLGIALLLNLGIVAGQIGFGLVSGSLGLLADAGHNLTDVAALVVALLAVRLARRPPTATRSFGMHRSTVLAAQANAAAILAVTALIAIESIRRLSNPGAVEGGIVLVVAGLAAIGNLVAAAILGGRHAGGNAEGGHDGHDHRDLNMRSAWLHMASDAAASAGVAATGAVILLTGGWYWLDPAVSLVISVLIAARAWVLLRETAEVLLEATPSGFDLDGLTRTMTEVPGVEAVHDVHVWTLSSDVRALSAHVVLDGHPTLEEAQVVGEHVKATVGPAFHIAHATLELECEACDDEENWCAIDRPMVPDRGERKR